MDGESFEDIQTGGLEEWRNGLGKQLHDQTCQPQPVRRVMIPKPGGGERPLGIPTIRDRARQTAAKLILEQPIWEADLEPNAYGCRPRKSAQDAIRKVDELRHEGYTDIVEADLSKCFDTIPHSEPMQCAARRIVGRQMPHRIKMWLKAPVEERDENGKRRLRGGQGQDRGTPQGGLIRPALANRYMNRMLQGWRQYFRCGSASQAYRAVDECVYDRVRNFPRRRHKASSQGARQFPSERVHGPLGVLRLQGPRAARARACDEASRKAGCSPWARPA